MMVARSIGSAGITGIGGVGGRIGAGIHTEVHILRAAGGGERERDDGDGQPRCPFHGGVLPSPSIV